MTNINSFRDDLWFIVEYCGVIDHKVDTIESKTVLKLYQLWVLGVGIKPSDDLERYWVQLYNHALTSCPNEIQYARFYLEQQNCNNDKVIINMFNQHLVGRLNDQINNLLI